MEIEYVQCVQFSFFSETFKAHFKIQTLPEIQQLDLTLVRGECKVTCNGSQNDCNVSTEERIMTNVSIPEQTSH